MPIQCDKCMGLNEPSLPTLSPVLIGRDNASGHLTGNAMGYIARVVVTAKLIAFRLSGPGMTETLPAAMFSCVGKDRGEAVTDNRVTPQEARNHFVSRC